MSEDPRSQERIDELILRHLDGDLSREEGQELDRALQGGPGVAERLREIAEQETLLEEALGGRAPALPTFPARRVRPRSLAAAALILAATGGVAWYLAGRPPAAPRFRGELLSLADGRSLLPGASPQAGRRYLARAGVLTWPGARVDVLAPTVFELGPAGGGGSPPIRLALSSGHVRIETTGPPGSVEVATPRGRIRNMGTIFEIRLNETTEEREMVEKIRAGTFPVFVLATVLTGQITWEGADGAERVLAPESGPVKLADDFSAGRVRDREGLVCVRPVGAGRWTAAREGAVLERGDLVKTGARGAHVAEIALADGSVVTLGPGGQLEVTSGGEVRVHRGELEVRPGDDGLVVVAGRDRREVTEPAHLRAEDGALSVRDDAPAWLERFRSRESTDALGSLLVEVDGRNEPLSIGYHQVTVDIRDQIARTVVEESFVNHTDAVLEGVFYFPLPADASISGFGMWIGDELVEADIVEKQRAREIYETILREKRDPALLEWTGGNVFKASVYPIPAHGEKRIRIVYTQVLERTGSAYRYSYALRSEALTTSPLRRLAIRVDVSSRERLTRVDCTSHPVRSELTAHAARVEYHEEEVTPRRDFEVVVESKPPESGAVAIPHRRGEDGYFMLLVQGPGALDRRGLVRDGEPLRLVVVADTSASMTDEQLRIQRLVVRGLLESLGPDDEFHLLAADATRAWATDGPSRATPESIERAIAFLEDRGAIGWTDVAGALVEASSRAVDGSHVVYVGDGIQSRGDPDPALLAARLRELEGVGATFHAIAPGSTRDPLALRSIAAVGGGAILVAPALPDATDVVRRLLSEITAPGLRGLELRMEGLRVAGVHPEGPISLPAGRQLLILGRYLPESERTAGTLRLTGTLRGEPWSREVPVDLSGAEQGNSFIPRFWARRHLDHLLEQGRSPDVVARIISLSKRHGIITPYTSLLVLESDADRERFQVERQFKSRDGEEFFAEGRGAVDLALAREQMRRARQWRQGLFEQVMRTYQGLGEELGRPRQLMVRERYLVDEFECMPFDMSAAGIDAPWGGVLNGNGDLNGNGVVDFDVDYLVDREPGLLPPATLDPVSGPAPAFQPLRQVGERLSQRDPYAPGRPGLHDDWTYRKYPVGSRSRRGNTPMFLGTGFSIVGWYSGSAYGRTIQRWPPGGSLDGLVPKPGAPSVAPPARWPAAVREALRGLDRRPQLAGRPEGLRVRVETETIDHRDRSHPGPRATLILSSEGWVDHQQSAPGGIPYLRWVRDGRRGICDLGRGLGGQREAKPADSADWPAPFGSWFVDLGAAYRGYTPAISTEPGRVELGLTQRGDPRRTVRISIDPERKAILEVVSLHRGRRTSTVRFLDLVEVAEGWWPTRIETLDDRDRVVRRDRVAWEALDADAASAALSLALAAVEGALLIDLPYPKPFDARTRLAAGEATLADRWALLLREAAAQRWDEAREHLEAFEALAAGRRGLDWIRLEALRASRRGEEAKGVTMELARRLAEAPRPGDHELARALWQGASGTLQAIEKLDLLEELLPVVERQDARLAPRKEWMVWRRDALREQGAVVAWREAVRELASVWPDDVSLVIDLSNVLAETEGGEAAVAYLDRVRAEHGPWTDSEVTRLRGHAASLLHDRRRLVDFLACADRWVSEEPARAPDSILDRYLSALVMLDREREADDRIARWLQGGHAAEAIPLAAARLRAAVAQALGEGEWLRNDRPVDARWRAPLAAVVRACWRVEERSDVVRRILGSHRFRSTDEGVAVQRELYDLLAGEIASLAPHLVRHARDLLRQGGYLPVEGQPSREDVARRLLERWAADPDSPWREHLAATIAGWGSREVSIDLRRRQLSLARHEEEAAEVSGQLFELLLTGEIDADTERELTTLLGRLGHDEGATAVRIDALRRLVARLVDLRTRERLAAIPDRGKKTRRALLPLEEAAREEARKGVLGSVERIETALRAKGIHPWVRLERWTLEARLGRPATELAREVMDGSRSSREASPDDPLAGARSILLERCLRVLGYLATRPGADPAIRADLQRLLDERTGREDGQEDGPESEASPWRRHLQWLLIALDRADELEARLRAWVAATGEDRPSPWRIPLAYLLAERGQLEEAARVMEVAVRRDDPSADALRTLAGWHLALGRDDARRDALIRAWETQGEWSLRSSLSRETGRYRRYQGNDSPEDLSEDVFFRFAALWRKAQQPAQHLNVLSGYYRATKDFRLLEQLPDAMLGHSAARVYPFVQALATVLHDVREEATVDRVVRRIEALRGEKELTVVDARALALLEFLIERGAARQEQGGEPHLERAVAALRAARKGEWAAGEPLLMARLLGSLVQLGRQPGDLGREQLDQLRELHDGAKTGTRTRLEIAYHRARVLRVAGEKDRAIVVLGGGLDEYRAAQGGRLPPDVRSWLETYASWLQDDGDHVAAERLWRRELALDPIEQHRRWLFLELADCLVLAVRRDAVALRGRGPQVYTPARDEMLAALEGHTDERHAADIVARLCRLFGAAHERGFEGVGRDLRSLAYETLPGVLAMYRHRGGERMVREVADRLRRDQGWLAGVEFLVSRAENEPRWLRRVDQDFWRHHGWRLADYRHEVGEGLGPLEPRVLAIFRAEVRRDLLEVRSRNRRGYHRSHADFWSARTGAFAEVAAAVLRERGDDEAIARHVADYLWHGLARHDEAIAALDRLERRGSLGRDGRVQLVRYLQERERWARTLPILEALVAAEPDFLDHRILTIRSLHHLARDPDARVALAAAHDRFHEAGRWSEAVAAAMGRICVEVGFAEAATGYLDEAIKMRTAAVGNRGVGDGRLWEYYQKLARAWATLGRTTEAVDAAAGAIITRGQDQKTRAEAEAILLEVLKRSPDLDAWVGRFEAELARDGRENPIVRKALGKVYLEREAAASAARHLAAAVEHGPPDAATLRSLVEALDASGGESEATRRLLELARGRSGGLAVWKEVGERQAKAGRHDEAERAFTSLAEMSVGESEGHALLAEVREASGRHLDAAECWRQVIRIRTGEPAGYLGLGRSLIAAGRAREAREILEPLLARDWEERFGDVKARVRELLSQ